MTFKWKKVYDIFDFLDKYEDQFEDIIDEWKDFKGISYKMYTLKYQNVKGETKYMVATIKYNIIEDGYFFQIEYLNKWIG